MICYFVSSPLGGWAQLDVSPWVSPAVVIPCQVGLVSSEASVQRWMFRMA